MRHIRMCMVETWSEVLSLCTYTIEYISWFWTRTHRTSSVSYQGCIVEVSACASTRLKFTRLKRAVSSLRIYVVVHVLPYNNTYIHTYGYIPSNYSILYSIIRLAKYQSIHTVTMTSVNFRTIYQTRPISSLP